MKTKYLLLFILLGFLLGIVTGLLIVKPKVGETVYVKGETLVDSITVHKYDTIYYPKYVQLPSKRDTLWRDSVSYVTLTIDTAAIIKDYTAEKHYAYNLFDNEYGSVDLEQVVQYNALKNTKYKYNPIEKQVVREKKYTPFMFIGYNTFKQPTVQIGVFKYNTGVYYKYIHDTSMGQLRTGHEIGVGIKLH